MAVGTPPLPQEAKEALAALDIDMDAIREEYEETLGGDPEEDAQQEAVAG